MSLRSNRVPLPWKFFQQSLRYWKPAVEGRRAEVLGQLSADYLVA